MPWFQNVPKHQPEIIDLSSDHDIAPVIVHSFVYVYQRVILYQDDTQDDIHRYPPSVNDGHCDCPDVGADNKIRPTARAISPGDPDVMWGPVM